MPESVNVPVPDQVQLVAGSRGLQLRGPAEMVVAALQALRVLAEHEDGDSITWGEWTLLVSEYIPETPDNRTVALPARAWKVLPSVLTDAAYGGYGPDSATMWFGDVGFLSPDPDPDVGIDVVGSVVGPDLESDDQRARGSRVDGDG